MSVSNDPDVIVGILRAYVSVGPDKRMREICGAAAKCITDLTKIEKEDDCFSHSMTTVELGLTIKLAILERCSREFLVVSTCDAETSGDARKILTELLRVLQDAE